MCTQIRLLFFFNDTATTEIYTLSLHDALPICVADDRDHQGPLALLVRDVDGDAEVDRAGDDAVRLAVALLERVRHEDRKSTRLNSSHANISYAVFCLKKTTLRHSPARYGHGNE